MESKIEKDMYDLKLPEQVRTNKNNCRKNHLHRKKIKQLYSNPDLFLYSDPRLRKFGIYNRKTKEFISKIFHLPLYTSFYN